MNKDASTGNGFDDGNVVFFGKGGEFALGTRIEDATAGDDEGLLGLFQQGDGFRDFETIRTGAANAVNALVEEGCRIVIGFALRILTEREENRAAIGRIKQGADGLRERLQDLLRAGDAVPVAGHGLEGIIDGEGRIIEVFDLLQHGIRQAIGEGIAREHQDRKAVGVGSTRSCDHVQRAGADGGNGNHHLAALLGLGESDGSERHGLLVLAAPCREFILHLLERFGQAGDIAMAENGEGSGEKGNFDAVDLGVLCAEIFDQGLGHGEPDRFHGRLPNRFFEPVF